MMIFRRNMILPYQNMAIFTDKKNKIDQENKGQK